MFARIADILTRDPDSLTGDFLGALGIVSVFFAALCLPVLT